MKLKGTNMNAYNGHRSWNHWNATLWMSIDVAIGEFITECVKAGHTDKDLIKMLYIMIGDSKTPDGAVINKRVITNYVHTYILS